jgi:hypothetical protein
MIPTLTVGGRVGCLFRAQLPANFCFVPLDQLVQGPEGKIEISELAYVQEGWSTQNMRWADSESDGSHLYPDLGRPVDDLEAPAVQEFLRRISSRTRHPFG